MGLLQDISHYWTEQLDPRVADLLFVASSYQVPLIIFAYLYFVLVCGPRFMKNKSPYSLETFMKLYNIVQIVGNGWLLYDCINVGLFSCKLICPVFDYSSMRFVKNAYYYFLLKILDCVETGIFILRKKDNQVSVLHLYHHVSTLFLTWAGRPTDQMFKKLLHL
ncbi:elongation of very long chain fatty acids protein 1-like isoform X2 [Pogonomyrmex barbatus]|uniref:Elongation of very long chain fatty acids protein n=1 Tax=Pogonomyrmex barbatus TaxID=144034 RepID=A0A6I9VYD1_9HYME|nr:elongation of very long chain fatty acids protein 1-like isoform X2 [Pogonomyrmex barbatus]